MPTRRKFIRNSALGALGITAGAYGFAKANQQLSGSTPPKISLAQWSLNRAFFKKELNPEDFASIARNSYAIGAVEYVNAFYKPRAKDEAFWAMMKSKAANEGVKSLLIMVDDEGDLGDPDQTNRKQAVENHYKWVNAASILGCHSIRVNAFGSGKRELLKKSLTDGLGSLSEYAAKEQINILIENHGLHTSDAYFIVDIIEQVNNPYLGTLPDFGNWCLSSQWGSTQKACDDIFDPYLGVKLFLPFAKGVSAKAYDFDKSGIETRIDYHKMSELVREAGYSGYIGIEYEGVRLSEADGIIATKNLIQQVWTS